MNTIVKRKRTSFRLNADLLNRLHLAAREEHCSLNAYVENILEDAVCHIPNEETRIAIEEAKSGDDLKKVDMSSLSAFIGSCSE